MQQPHWMPSVTAADWMPSVMTAKTGCRLLRQLMPSVTAAATGCQVLQQLPLDAKCYGSWHWMPSVTAADTGCQVLRQLTLDAKCYSSCHWMPSVTAADTECRVLQQLPEGGCFSPVSHNSVCEEPGSNLLTWQVLKLFLLSSKHKTELSMRFWRRPVP